MKNVTTIHRHKVPDKLKFLTRISKKGVNYGISLFMYNMYCNICRFFYLAYDSRWSKMVK